MGQLDFLDVNDAKIEELWKRYLTIRGLASGSDPIPQGESPIDFRRKWEKYLYSQSPSGAVATTGGATTTAGGTVVVEATKPVVPDIPNGGYYGDPKDALAAGKVLLFEHKDFLGSCWAFGVGQKAMMAEEPFYISNDTISSVRVPQGYELILYAARDFQGASRRITGDVAYLGDEWNDIASSLQVRRIGAAQGRYTGAARSIRLGR